MNLSFVSLFSTVAMFVTAILSINFVGRRVGRSLALTATCAGLYSLFIFCEYYSESLLGVATSRVQALDLFFLVRLFSLGAGVFSHATAWAILTVAVFMPPASGFAGKLRLIFLSACFTGGVSLWGVLWELSGEPGAFIIHRSPTGVFYFQAVVFFSLLILSALIFFRKYRNFMSLLRRRQCMFIGVGLCGAMFAGGSMGYFLPNLKLPVIVASVSPLIFVITALFGLVMTRKLFSDGKELFQIAARLSANATLEERLQTLGGHGYEITLFVRHKSQEKFYDVMTPDFFTPPPPAKILNLDIFFWEDFDDLAPGNAEYEFMLEQEAEAGIHYTCESHECLLLVHSFHGKIAGHRQIRRLQEIFRQPEIFPKKLIL